jgi:hypothetical protein
VWVEGVANNSTMVEWLAMVNLLSSSHLNFFLRILDGRFPSPFRALSWLWVTEGSEPRSEPDQRDGSNRRTQWFKLVVGVNLVGFRRRVAGELLPDFLRDAGVGHYAIKGVPQAVKA